MKILIKGRRNIWRRLLKSKDSHWESLYTGDPLEDGRISIDVEGYDMLVVENVEGKTFSFLPAFSHGLIDFS